MLLDAVFSYPVGGRVFPKSMAHFAKLIDVVNTGGFRLERAPGDVTLHTFAGWEVSDL